MPKYQLHIGTIVFSLLLLVPIISAQAAYNDVTLTTDTVLTVGGYNLTVSGSSALLQSIEVGSSDFSITIATGSAMTVTSADRKVFTVDGVTSAYVTQSCSDSVSTLTITVPSGSEAVPTALIIPTATVCSTASAGSNISSGSSPGGFGSPAPVAVTAPVVIPAVILATFPGCPAGVTCTPIPSAFSASVVLTSDLSRGTEGSDVETLQKFLARFSEIYPEGIANGFFGPATERAVKRFQAKYGISQVGRVGPATRAKIVEVSATGGAVPATVPAPTITPLSGVTPATTAVVVFNTRLTKGTSGEDVKNLQKILNKDPETQITTEGTGSPGNETDYFGSLTEQAVQKFQVKYGIANPGDEGYGQVGPKTRMRLNQLGL